MEKEINTSILHDWVVKLDLKHQAHLLPVLRGCDTEHKELKKVTKMLRWLIGKNFVTTTNYSDNTIMSIKNVAYIIEYYGNVENKHWYDHVMLTIKTIVEVHPDPYVRKYWEEVLSQINSLTKLPDRIYRMLKERNDLNDKISKLTTWMDNHKEQVTEEQEEQLYLMTKYANIVNKRLTTYCEEETLVYKSGVIQIGD